MGMPKDFSPCVNAGVIRWHFGPGAPLVLLPGCRTPSGSLRIALTILNTEFKTLAVEKISSIICTANVVGSGSTVDCFHG